MLDVELSTYSFDKMSPDLSGFERIMTECLGNDRMSQVRESLVIMSLPAHPSKAYVVPTPQGNSV